jgi:CBS domain containing-hemolysin-like protein
LAGPTFDALARAARKGDAAHVAGYDFAVIDLSRTRTARVLARERPRSDEGEAGAATVTPET